MNSNNKGWPLEKLYGENIVVPSEVKNALAQIAFDTLTPRSDSPLRKPVFVVGAPRSGTTLLGSCLSNHPQFSGAEESLFLTQMWLIFADLHQGVNPRKWGPLQQYIEANEMLNAIGIFSDSIFTNLVGSDGRVRYVDHTPWYVALIRFINLLYPDSVFVHIIRDGREVVNSLSVSYASGFKWCGSSTAERTRLWSELVEHGRHQGSFLPKDRYYEVRYEELCLYPEATLQHLMKALGCSWDDDVLSPLTVPHAGPSRPDAMLAIRDSEQKLQMRPRSTGNRWPLEWNDNERLEFMEQGGDMMRKLGYTTSSED